MDVTQSAASGAQEMKNEFKTKEQLFKEYEALRRRLAKLENSQKRHRQVEEVIREQNQLFKSTIDSLPYPFFVIDANDYIIKIANSTARQTGPLGASTCYALTHNKSKPCSGREHICPLKEVKKTKKPVTVEHIHYDRDGNHRNVEVHGYPIIDDNGSVGQMVVYNLDLTEHRRAEEARVDQAAALARAKELRQSQQRIVNVQETLRRSIARQLHGSVQNRLVVLLHQLTELEQIASSEGLAGKLGNMRRELLDLLERHVRPITHQLYPSIIRRGLIPALESLGDQIEAVVTFDLKLQENFVKQESANHKLISEPVKLVAYRIAEEALTNVVKYAKASEVIISLEQPQEGWLCLMVKDNGQGFSFESVKTQISNNSGFGLSGMRERGQSLHGDVEIISALGEGTSVNVRIPVTVKGA